jgi:hypothetical protein
MPYKDPDKRREYHRQYKQRQRTGLSTPVNPVTKCYFCLDDPELKIGDGVEFYERYLFTNDPEVQDLIEDHKGYGEYIVSWRVEP